MPRKPSTKGVATAALALNPGQQIRAARLKAGWSQTELGERLNGITRARVQQIESWAERSRPSFAWFLEHGEVWIELGLKLDFFAQVSRGACPTCQRPY